MVGGCAQGELVANRVRQREILRLWDGERHPGEFSREEAIPWAEVSMALDRRWRPS